ncbi:hypothetical protein YIM1627_16380 [Thermus oshimai]
MALEAAYLDLPHPDPADRFILATALRLGTPGQRRFGVALPPSPTKW